MAGAIKWLWATGMVLLTLSLLAWISFGLARPKAIALGCVGIALIAFGNAVQVLRR